jgi:hypothetical protein
MSIQNSPAKPAYAQFGGVPRLREKVEATVGGALPQRFTDLAITAKAAVRTDNDLRPQPRGLQPSHEEREDRPFVLRSFDVAISHVRDPQLIAAEAFLSR